jgi:hypothetical protein
MCQQIRSKRGEPEAPAFRGFRLHLVLSAPVERRPFVRLTRQVVAHKHWPANINPTTGRIPRRSEFAEPLGQ